MPHDAPYYLAYRLNICDNIYWLRAKRSLKFIFAHRLLIYPVITEPEQRTPYRITTHHDSMDRQKLISNFPLARGTSTLAPTRSAPAVRGEHSFAAKLALCKELGFDYIQFHDDDAVPDEFSASEREKRALEVKRQLDDHGLKPSSWQPRLWEDERGIDGPVTSNNAAHRQWALERGKRSIDVARPPRN
jgi:hypothetical protein